jgi:hypothetical protein
VELGIEDPHLSSDGTPIAPSIPREVRGMRVRWIVWRLAGFLLPLVALGLAARLAHGDEKNEKKVPVIDARPSASAQKWLAPTGTVFGTATPLRNQTSGIQNPPHSPTPPEFPFGLRTNMAPRGGGGGSPPGPLTGFTNQGWDTH